MATRHITIAAMIPASNPTEPVAPTTLAEQLTAAIFVLHDDCLLMKGERERIYIYGRPL